MAKELGAIRCVKDISELADVGLTTIVDFAGFGSTTTGAIEAVSPRGRVVQVGMGRVASEFNSIPLIVKEVELVGSVGGGPVDLKGVLDLMASGELSPEVSTWEFESIPEGLDKLRRGEVKGRLVVDMRDRA